MKKHLLTLTILASVTLLSGCDTDNNPIIHAPAASAVVQTIDPGYMSSEVLFLDPVNQQVSSPFYSKTKSDYTLATNNGDIYHIGRYYIDNIDKYAAQDYENAAWSFSTKDGNHSVSSNPYNLVFANDNKAYLIRYGSAKVWIVNPNAEDAASFKIGEIDLSAYNPADNSSTPSPASAVISQGKLYIAMQRLSASFSMNPAYIAVFDITDDSEIETNSVIGDSLKGILLQGLNPLENSLFTGPDGKIYVTTHNEYPNSWAANPKPIDISKSMIEVIEPNDNSLSTLLTGADLDNNTENLLYSTVILSAEQGYFYTAKLISSYPFQEESKLYEFNPTTGAIIDSNVASKNDEHIGYLGLDKKGFLWLSMINPATPGVDIIDTIDNTQVGSRLLTKLNPNVIRFLN